MGAFVLLGTVLAASLSEGEVMWPQTCSPVHIQGCGAVELTGLWTW